MKKKHKFRRFMVNLLCGVVPGEKRRRKIRVVLNTNFISIYHFIKRDCGIKHPKLKTTIGSRGKNLVVNVNNKYVYKFRVAIDDFNDSLERREYDITFELNKVSPVPIIVPKIIRFAHGVARRYDFVPGVNFRQLVKCGVYNNARDVLVPELAKFIYSISNVDPVKIRKYKQNPKQKTDYMLGWNHTDLFENFLIDEKTFHINGVIDWEEVAFQQFDLNRRFPDLPVFDKFMRMVKICYDNLYCENK